MSCRLHRAAAALPRPAWRPCLRTAAAAVAIGALLPLPAAHADLQELMDEQFTALTNYTGPATFQTSRRGVLAGGGLYTRVPIMTERLASFVPPSFEAGCGGIDFFAGSFSFINADQFVALMKATAANAAGYAFQVAMSAMCETCMAAIETLQKKIQELNQYFGNSCQLAQGIVNDTASAMGFQRIGSASIVNTAAGVADVFGAWSGSDGQSPEVKAATSAPDEYAERVQGNLVWRELKQREVEVWFLGGDNELLELAMNITGTVVVGPLAEAEDGGEAPELARIMPNPELFRVLVEGGEVTIRGCGDGYDADACLELVDRTITVTGYQQRLRELLLGDGVEPGLVQLAVSNEEGISAAQESLLAVLPGSVGGLVYRTAQFSYPAGYTFGEQAAPVLAVQLAAEVCRKLLFATGATAAMMHHPYEKEVLALIRDANQGLQASVAEMQARYGSMADLVSQYADLLAVASPFAPPVPKMERTGEGS
ncbi:MAG: conjugal transfer protein TraH [Geminicoccaceae bacterium]